MNDELTKEARNFIDKHKVWKDGVPLFRRDLAKLLAEFVEHCNKEKDEQEES